MFHLDEWLLGLVHTLGLSNMKAVEEVASNEVQELDMRG